MNTKLTLNLDRKVIERAKKYARGRSTSVSKMTERYLRAIVEEKTEEISYSPIVEELSGIIKLDNKLNTRDEYTNFLIEKYK